MIYGNNDKRKNNIRIKNKTKQLVAEWVPVYPDMPFEGDGSWEGDRWWEGDKWWEGDNLYSGRESDGSGLMGDTSDDKLGAEGGVSQDWCGVRLGGECWGVVLDRGDTL